MCIVYLKKNPSPNIKFLVISNRDEFYSRPFESISEWKNGIIAGKDSKKNGTWLGFNIYGNFSFVTNFRKPLERDKKYDSRGLLVADFLEKGTIPDNNKLRDFRPFNLIYGDLKNLHFISNIAENKLNTSPSSLCISNGNLDNQWPKMQRLEKLLNQVNFDQSIDNLKNDLFEILNDEVKAEMKDLPVTGLSIEQEHIISSIFIQSPTYGTVSQNISIIDSNDNLHMFERNVKEKTEKVIKAELDIK
jgi:uncharacterized protein with NRDE domain